MQKGMVGFVVSELPRPIDFAIVGTAKSGTSSLAQLISYSTNARVLQPKDSYYFQYLNAHPRYSGPKSDAAVNRVEEARVGFPSQLAKLPKDALVGDACVYSMYSQSAVSNIKRHLSSNGRIFVCLRRPDERAFSAYMHARRDGDEQLTFAEALVAEDGRIRDNWVELWWYQKLGYYADAVERLYDVFGRDRVEIILYEELTKSPDSAAAATMLTKAGIALGKQLALPHLNASGSARSRLVQKIIVSESRTKAHAKKIVPARFRRRMRGAIQRMNVRRMSIPSESRKLLIANYEKDIQRLAVMTGLELSHWTKQ